MADKLTVGGIQQLSDKPAPLDPSKKFQVRVGKPSGVMVREDRELLDDMTEARAEGYAAGRAEVSVTEVQLLFDAVHAWVTNRHPFLWSSDWDTAAIEKERSKLDRSERELERCTDVKFKREALEHLDRHRRELLPSASALYEQRVLERIRNAGLQP